ncbi:Asp-tRNA(Asn)/Glu-tRNA(Gln) amidotransferase subunit GatA, partial [Candidatus Gottesmanbacteria bacterium]|nr:Asp-tRNA(Asn)/Glu-tRNA(Gln) amidotransferase subunit GatA [Candidatus Gottesmanbacteria bacterium]
YGLDRKFFGDEAKRRIMLGTHTLSVGYYDAYYRKALKVRTLIKQDFERVFKEVNVIIGPTSPCTALGVGATTNDPIFGEVQDMLVEPSTMAGLPGISIPCGFVSGLPVGMQIIGPELSESLILRVAHAYQKATNWHLKRPNIKLL